MKERNQEIFSVSEFEYRLSKQCLGMEQVGEDRFKTLSYVSIIANRCAIIFNSRRVSTIDK